MKNIVIGLLLALSLFEGFQAYKWKKVADVRGWKAEQVYDYLSRPVTTFQGKDVNRAMIIDALAQQALVQAQSTPVKK